MTNYIDVVIDTDPQDIMDDFVTFMQTVVPGWEPNVPTLDVWLMQAVAAAAAETRDVASAVPKSIFRWYGANLLNLPPIDATSATVTSKWTVQDNAGYTIPAGTQVSIAKNGTDVFAFETTVDVTIPPGSTQATGVQLVAVTPGADSSGLGGVNTVVQLIDPLSFVTAITQDTVTTSGLDAEDDDAYLTRLASQLQLSAPRPILPADFAVFARQIAGVGRATPIDGYNPLHNLLSANQASAETDASGWVNISNTTVASSAAFAADGAKSVSMTAVAAADMTVATPQTAGTGIPATPGETYTGLVSLRANGTVRSCQVGLQWLDAANAQIGAVVYGAAANDSAGAFINYSVTALAPALTARVRVVTKVIGAAIGEIHYADKASLRHGSGTDWVAGGTPETGNARTITIAATDTVGAALDGTHKAAVLADLQARREVNFNIYIIDPNYNIIDVTYQVKALAGYDLPTLVASINAAITAYLNPAAWGAGSDPKAWSNQTVVRYLEIAQVINQVPGVDYITTTGGLMDLQMGIHGGALARADITLAGVAPLPTTTGGTLTGVAV